MVCFDCGKLLTDEESYYYDGHCEKCERDWHDRIKRWRKGGDDPKLDAMFSAPPRTVH